ncbi:MAG: hypothetical protein Q9P44_21775 [Anaerolineae bacterium]|nr:hypothetical protein [Anaerolineae bacterium]
MSMTLGDELRKMRIRAGFHTQLQLARHLTLLFVYYPELKRDFSANTG